MGKRRGKLTFAEIYQDVKPEYKERLLDFRAAHPYKRVTLHGVPWEYIAAGQGDEALLLLGGGLSVGEAAFDTILRYAESYRVLSPSYPAVGTMGNLVDGLVKLLDAEGIARAHVFGHSMGAAVAHVLVRRHPERVDKLALSGFGLYTARNARRAKSGLAMFKWMPDGYIRAVYMPKIRRMLGGIDPDESTFMTAYFEELFALHHTKGSLVGQFNLLADMVIHADDYHVHGKGWSGTFSPVVQIVALLVMIGGIALSDWAMAANKFFSGVIRIQEDRGHTVETGGPYRFVRHPGYVGGILHHVAAPLMLGSWWALIPGGIGALLFVIRTALEDKTLQDELPGYVEYTQRTRYRLVPWIW